MPNAAVPNFLLWLRQDDRSKAPWNTTATTSLLPPPQNTPKRLLHVRNCRILSLYYGISQGYYDSKLKKLVYHKHSSERDNMDDRAALAIIRVWSVRLFFISLTVTHTHSTSTANPCIKKKKDLFGRCCSALLLFLLLTSQVRLHPIVGVPHKPANPAT